MLYQQNKRKKLDPELFLNPSSEYRAAPFWAWNTKLEEDLLSRQIAHFQEMGFGGFHIHTRTGLVDEYLGKRFLDMVDFSCRKAEEIGMLTWLYDEDRWSSGSAGGQVTRHRPFRRKRLEMHPEKRENTLPKEEALERGEPYLLAVYDVSLDGKGFLSSFRRVEEEDAPFGERWYAYCFTEEDAPWYNGEAYLDAMDREAVSRFIQITYEAYKKKIGTKFGKSVFSIFTDEPNANQQNTAMAALQREGMFPPTPFYRGKQIYTWTRFFEEGYRKMYGEEFLDVLPLLIWKKADGTDSLVKYRYFDFIAETFSQNYSRQLGEWCQENGIYLTGHYLNENDLQGQTTSCGEIMRNYGYMGLPGIDILCDAKEFTTAKQAQSAVHQYGKEGMMSELYGVTGWEFDFRGYKTQGDWQAALGVSVRVPHLAWMCMRGPAKRDYPASIGYQSPWYREYRCLEDHFARLNTALTRGKAIVRIGVIHPVESYWISTGPLSQTAPAREALEANFAQITDWLLKNHLDFDFICESVLPGLVKDTSSRNVGEMKYDAIVIPGNLSLRGSTLAFLDHFAKAGGKVVFMGKCPAYVDGVLSDAAEELYQRCRRIDFDRASLLAELEEERCVRIQNSHGVNESGLIYTYRQDGEDRWLFIACHEKFGENAHAAAQNDVTSPQEITVTLQGVFYPVEYDTLTGKQKPVAFWHKDGKTVLQRTYFACDSALILLCNTKQEVAEEIKDLVPIRRRSLKGAVAYGLSEPNVLLLDQGEYRFDDGPFQEAEEMLRISRLFREKLGFPSDRLQPYTVKENPATHFVTMRFTFESEIQVQNALLAVEDAEKIRIRFNEIPVEKSVVGYFADEGIQTVKLPVIPVGKNVLEIVFPYTERTNLEWCYLLGDFGVRVRGFEKVLTPLPEKIGFGSVTTQLLPFYSGNVIYSFQAELEKDGAVQLEASYYRGALIGVEVDGKKRGSIIFPPYRLLIPDLKKGVHEVKLTLFGHRNNSFGPLHMVNRGERWIGPAAWRTRDQNWCYEYQLSPLGILKSPEMTFLEEKNEKSD